MLHTSHHIIGPLTIKLSSISLLKRAKNKERWHSECNFEQVAATIRHFYFTNLIIINEEGTIIAGHARYEAARSLQIPDVPTIQLTYFNFNKLRAYWLADSKIAANVDLDPDILRIELGCSDDLGLPFRSAF